MSYTCFAWAEGRATLGSSPEPTQVLFKGWGWKSPPPPNHPLTTEKRKTRPPALVNCHRKVATFPQRSPGKSVGAYN